MGVTVDGGKASGANAADAGGAVTVTGGQATAGNGGNVVIRGGPSTAGSSSGGDVQIKDGDNNLRMTLDENQITMTSADTWDASSVGLMNLKTTAGYSDIHLK